MAENKSLARVSKGASELDPYEAKYMAGQGATMLHAKTRSNWQAPAFMGTTAALVFAWCAAHAQLALGVGLAGFLVVVGLFFAVLRVKVTAEYVDVQYGMLGPKIPVASIEAVEAVQHGRTNLARWGISPVGWGEWLYSVSGDGGRAAKITWVNRGGKRRVHYIGTPDPDELVSAIEAARAGSRSGSVVGELE